MTVSMPNKKFNFQLSVLYRNGKKQFVLLPGRTTIGRRTDNSIVIPDPTVSGYHAAILFENSKLVIEDLGSSNGTFVNNKRLTMPYRLVGGEQIKMGLCQITLSAGPSLTDQPVNTATAIQNKAIQTNYSNKIAPFKATAFEKKKVSNAYIEFLRGGKPGITRLELDKTVNPIGRLDTGVASISFGRNGWTLSYVDGIKPVHNGRVIGKNSVALKGDDVIEIGELKVRFVI